MLSPATPGAASDVGEAAVSAHDHGRKLFLMLQASSFSDEQKVAWAGLLPFLSLVEIDRLAGLLEKNLTEQIVEEFEDVFLKAKAAQTKRDLSADALDMKIEGELAVLEQDLMQSEQS